MTHIRKITNTLAAVALACLTLASAACSDDDDNNTPAPDKQGEALTLQDVAGSYAGTFDFTAEPSELNPNPEPQTGIAVSLEVTEKGTLHFAEFPAATLVEALLGDAASGVIAMLGTVTYDAAIGTPTADASKLTAALTTPDLVLSLMAGALKVQIAIEAPEQLSYTKEGKLAFTLKTLRCTLGDGDPMDLVNTLTFTVQKQ